jgi:DNA invertase Pin-like site-specific DNA recombinase
VEDAFNFDGPAADVVLAVLAWAAQMERAAIGDRICAARVRIEASGGSWGRPRRVDDDTVATVLKKAKSASVRQIAMGMKIPKSTVQDIVSGKGAYKRAPDHASKTRH